VQYFIKRAFFTLFSIFILTVVSRGQNFPAKPGTLVNDYTNVLSWQQVSSLEQKLTAFDDSTSTQIAVVLIPSLEGYDVSDYAVRLAEKWGVGSAENDNGIMLLVSIGDRKVTIQTGYGVEGALPDAIAKRIIENEIKPEFKTGNYYAGLEKGTDAIIAYTKGEYKNTKPKNSEGRGIPAGLIILIAIIIIAVISRRGGGGGGRVIGSRGGADLMWWTLMSGMAGRNRGSGWGGFSGGGGFGGGGGGFGGFGGGSFGGGGASGSW